MPQSPRGLSRKFAIGALGALALFAAIPRAAIAHEFSVELRAVGNEREVMLADALRGFLLATTERDGHANEESNGHLGGLDVYIDPEPAQVATLFPELKPIPAERAEIVVLLGSSQDALRAAEAIGQDRAVLLPGNLLDDNQWAVPDGQNPQNFAARYQSAYGQQPSQWAALGYDAARRLDAAIRPLGGIDDRAALVAVFAQTAAGVRW